MALGQSHRSLGIEMTIRALLAIASGNKAFTALVVMSLVEQGDLALDSQGAAIDRRRRRTLLHELAHV